MTQVEIIARHYGKDEQGRQTTEELAELIVAINKLHRNNNNIDGLIEELADVSLMIEQMIYLYDCEDEVTKIKIQKIKRQIERINRERKE